MSWVEERLCFLGCNLAQFLHGSGLAGSQLIVMAFISAVGFRRVGRHQVPGVYCQYRNSCENSPLLRYNKSKLFYPLECTMLGLRGLRKSLLYNRAFPSWS